MSAIIGQQVFTAGGNNLYLSLLRDEYIRQLSISNNWARLHIGLLVSIDASATFYGAELRFGVCTYANPPQGTMAWRPTNWLGFYSATPNSSATWTYTAGAGSPYTTNVGGGGTASGYLRRFGSSVTGFGSNSTPWQVASNAGATTFRRSIILLQITKGFPSYTLASHGTISVAQAQTDYTFANLLEATQSISASPPFIGQSQLTSFGAGALAGAANESTGIFDSISISWKSLFIPLSIYGIAVYRVY